MQSVCYKSIGSIISAQKPGKYVGNWELDPNFSGTVIKIFRIQGESIYNIIPPKEPSMPAGLHHSNDLKSFSGSWWYGWRNYLSNTPEKIKIQPQIHQKLTLGAGLARK